MNKIEEQILKNQFTIMGFLGGALPKGELGNAINQTAALLYPIDKETTEKYVEEAKDAFSELNEVNKE